MSAGTNIKARRFELKMSQQELADALGYKSRSTIAKIESGENDIPHSKLKLFAKALDTTEEYIAFGMRSEVKNEFNATMRKSPHGKGKHICVVLAGGKSTRNHHNIPNQFITVLGKPVIIYSLEAYQRHPAIDEIYVVCLKGWEDILQSYSEQFGIEKLCGIIPAGETGILSVKNAVDFLKDKSTPDDIIILQESTRPLITEEMISKLLKACKENGSAVTCEPMDEYVQFFEENGEDRYLDRNRVISTQSPEAYYYKTLIDAFRKAETDGHELCETCCAIMMYNLGYKLMFYEGNHTNIKIIRQEDIAVFSALLKQMT